MLDLDMTAAERRIQSLAGSIRDWGRGQAVATMGREGQTAVTSANELFDVVSDIDMRWYTEISDVAVPFDQAGVDRIRGLYREWSEAAGALLAALESGTERCKNISGLEQLRSNCREAQGILTPDQDFFDDPALIPRQEEALEADRRGETVEFEEMGD